MAFDASPGRPKQSEDNIEIAQAEMPNGDLRASRNRLRANFASHRFSFRYPEDFKPVARRWLVQKVVPEMALGVVFGPSGAGKSTFITALCCSVAIGAPFLGGKSKKRGVIYVGCEDAEGVMYRREAWIVRNETDRSSMAFAIIPEAPDLWSAPNKDAADIDVLIGQINEERWVQRERGAETGIVVLDTSRKAFPGMNEIDSADVDRMCRIARRIISECGVTVLFASHVAVAGSGEDPRGSGGFLGDVDFALGMKIEQGGRQVWVRKMRNGKNADGDQTLRWSYQLNIVDLGFFGEDGAPETAAVFHESGEPLPPPSARKKEPPGGARTVLRAVRDLLSENRGEFPPPGAQCPPGVRAITAAEALGRARANGISKGSCKDPMEASRKAFERGKQYWLEHGGLHERDGWLWLPK
jgi:AAA domain